MTRTDTTSSRESGAGIGLPRITYARASTSTDASSAAAARAGSDGPRGYKTVPACFGYAAPAAGQSALRLSSAACTGRATRDTAWTARLRVIVELGRIRWPDGKEVDLVL